MCCRLLVVAIMFFVVIARGRTLRMISHLLGELFKALFKRLGLRVQFGLVGLFYLSTPMSVSSSEQRRNEIEEEMNPVEFAGEIGQLRLSSFQVSCQLRRRGHAC